MRFLCLFRVRIRTGQTDRRTEARERPLMRLPGRLRNVISGANVRLSERHLGHDDIDCESCCREVVHALVWLNQLRLHFLSNFAVKLYSDTGQNKYDTQKKFILIIIIIIYSPKNSIRYDTIR